MGRVDEARRRAAEAAGQPADSTAPASVAELPEIDAIFPETEAAPQSPSPTPAALQGSEPVSQGDVAITPAPVPAPRDSGPSLMFDPVTGGSVERLVIGHAMTAASREQYRRLAAVLHGGQETAGVKVIMIASAVPAEGKTLTAANLALTMSESYKRKTLLIDADLRRPSQNALFGIVSPRGLVDCLKPNGDKRLPVHQVSEMLSVLPAGHATSDPMAGLTSDRMNRLLTEARSLFDWIILDTPPVGLLTDAHLLASMVDGALLVIRADSTPHELVRRAVDALKRERILGVVLNGAKAEHQHNYGAYARYYSQYQSASSEVAVR